MYGFSFLPPTEKAIVSMPTLPVNIIRQMIALVNQEAVPLTPPDRPTVAIALVSS